MVLHILGCLCSYILNERSVLYTVSYFYIYSYLTAHYIRDYEMAIDLCSSIVRLKPLPRPNILISPLYIDYMDMT